MKNPKPIDPEKAVAIVAKRRKSARDYYARLQEDARRYRDTAEHPDENGDATKRSNEDAT